MKVLILQPWIRVGGAELISVHLAHQVQRRGHDARIACTFIDPVGLPPEAKEVKYLLPAPWLERFCKESRLFFLVFGPWLLLGLAWKHSKGIDVINPHNFPASWVAAIVGALRRIPVVWTCNEPPERLARQNALTVGLGDFVGWWLASSWIDRLMVRGVAKVYVPSEKTRRQVRTKYGIDSSIIHLGMDPFFSERIGKDGLAKRLDLDGKFVLLTVGKLHPQKNQFLCIEALRKILTQIPNAVLVLAGDGPMAKEWASEAVRNGIAAHVRFLGRRNPQEVRQLYALCDVNLFPPTNQSWGLTPFEALSAGKISIVSNDCGAAEVIAEQGIGFVCDPTPEAFAQKILEVHKHPARCRAMARKGRTFVARNLTWTQYAEKVLGLMEDAYSPAEHPRREKAHGGAER